MYPLDGLLADEGTEYWQFCFGLPQDPAALQQKLDLYRARTRTSRAAPPTRPWPGLAGGHRHPFSGIINAARSSSPGP
jgi:hypothetical protein